MKTLLRKRALFIAFAMISAVTTIFVRCSQPGDTVTPLSGGIQMPGLPTVDGSWTHDQVHSNIQWATDFYDYSSTKLTGRFDVFNFRPALVFSDSNLAKCNINLWVSLSSFNTGQPGRDGNGQCGRSYLGITYLDSNYTMIDPNSDTAWFHSTSVVRSGSGYLVNGNFTFNRYRAPSGNPDGTPITHPCTLYLTYNGVKDFPNASGSGGKYRAGLTATFTFLRSQYMDIASTAQYIPVPKKAAAAGNVTAANNKTYGVYSTSTSDSVIVVTNIEMYKNHN